MIKHAEIIIDAHAIMNLIILNALLLGFVIAWLIFHFSSKPSKRPGINFKEF